MMHMSHNSSDSSCVVSHVPSEADFSEKKSRGVGGDRGNSYDKMDDNEYRPEVFTSIPAYKRKEINSKLGGAEGGCERDNLDVSHSNKPSIQTNNNIANKKIMKNFITVLSDSCDEQNAKVPGTVKVKLVSSSPQWDNKAEVEVLCENPDEVVDRMLQSIVEKFPPLSLVTVEKGNINGFVADNYSKFSQKTKIQCEDQQQFFHTLPNYSTQIVPSGLVAGRSVCNHVYPGYPAAMIYQPAPIYYTPIHRCHNSIRVSFPPTPRDILHQYPTSCYLNSNCTGSVSNAATNVAFNSLHHFPCVSQQQTSYPPSISAISTHFKRNETVCNIPQFVIPPKQLNAEVTRYVPKIEVREVIREIPKYQVEWVEKIVEVPQVQYIDKYEEVEQIQEVIRHVPKTEVIEVPRETIKYVPKIETKIVEQIVEVPRGEKIAVACVYPIDSCTIVPQFVDREVPVIMSRTMLPQVEETDEIYEVEVAKYIPELIPVDVFVPKPINVPIRSVGCSEERTPFKFDAHNECEKKEILMRIMHEMNPHIQQLELYNSLQNESFVSLVAHSANLAKQHGLSPPAPIYEALCTIEQQERSGFSGKIFNSSFATCNNISNIGKSCNSNINIGGDNCSDDSSSLKRRCDGGGMQKNINGVNCAVGGAGVVEVEEGVGGLLINPGDKINGKFIVGGSECISVTSQASSRKVSNIDAPQQNTPFPQHVISYPSSFHRMPTTNLAPPSSTTASQYINTPYPFNRPTPGTWRSGRPVVDINMMMSTTAVLQTQPCAPNNTNLSSNNSNMNAKHFVPFSSPYTYNVQPVQQNINAPQPAPCSFFKGIRRLGEREDCMTGVGGNTHPQVSSLLCTGKQNGCTGKQNGCTGKQNGCTGNLNGIAKNINSHANSNVVSRSNSQISSFTLNDPDNANNKNILNNLTNNNNAFQPPRLVSAARR